LNQNRWWRRAKSDSREEVIGRHFSLTQVPAEVQNAQSIVNTLFAGETIPECEFSRRNKDGSVGYHWFSAVPVYDENRVVAIEGFLIDTTEYRRTSEIYTLLFQHMTAGFALHEMVYDAEGKAIDYRFVDLNPAFESMTGLRASEVKGRTVLEVFPSTERYWIDTYATVADTNRPVVYRNFSRQLNKHFEVRAFSPERGLFASIVTERDA
jgi:PAS domain S-box-containing protein